MDIVERLRMKGPMSFQMDWSDRAKAADEIERLRQDKAEMLEMLKHLVRWHDQLSPNDIAKAQAIIGKLDK